MDETIRTIKKNRETDIIIKLKPIEGKSPKSSTGITDNRLFTGENNLHAIMDKQTCLWYMVMDSGVLPHPLKQRFTNFNLLLRHATDYYARRNIMITEVIDRKSTRLNSSHQIISYAVFCLK